MALDITYLNPSGGQSKRGRSPQQFTYATLDTHATVDTAGYFNGGVANGGAYNILEIGDMVDVVVWATAIGTGTISTYGRHIVLAKAAGVLNTSDVTVGAVTNTD